jgi:arylsulfatase A-like enzyme
LAVAGDAQVTDKLLKGYQVGGMTYKVHLDGYNLVPYLTGEAQKSPRTSFLYINDDQQLTGLRYDNWKIVFMEQRAQGTLRIWAEPFVSLRAYRHRRTPDHAGASVHGEGQPGALPLDQLAVEAAPPAGAPQGSRVAQWEAHLRGGDYAPRWLPAPNPGNRLY